VIDVSCPSSHCAYINTSPEVRIAQRSLVESDADVSVETAG